jgi:hypothetical protein
MTPDSAEGWRPIECRECCRPLSRAERLYYGDRCEACERAWSDRIDAWRKGEVAEPELDRFYSLPEPPK